jgi:hypothetical protein
MSESNTVGDVYTYPIRIRTEVVAKDPPTNWREDSGIAVELPYVDDNCGQ